MTTAQQTAPVISASGHTDSFGPNVADILARGTRVINGKVPAQVRKELASAVKAGVLGRLTKDGCKPEIYFHPDHKNGAIERQKREAEYASKCIASVIASPADVRDGIESMGGNVLEYALNEMAVSSKAGV